MKQTVWCTRRTTKDSELLFCVVGEENRKLKIGKRKAKEDYKSYKLIKYINIFVALWQKEETVQIVQWSTEDKRGVCVCGRVWVCVVF